VVGGSLEAGNVDQCCGSEMNTGSATLFWNFRSFGKKPGMSIGNFSAEDRAGWLRRYRCCCSTEATWIRIQLLRKDAGKLVKNKLSFGTYFIPHSKNFECYVSYIKIKHQGHDRGERPATWIRIQLLKKTNETNKNNIGIKTSSAVIVID
jgi:hypothetical protein